MHNYSPDLANSTMVQHSPGNVSSVSDHHSEPKGHFSSGEVREHRAVIEPQWGRSSIQSIWREATQDWSVENQEILAKGLASSTLKHYNSYWNRFGTLPSR